MFFYLFHKIIKIENSRKTFNLSLNTLEEKFRLQKRPIIWHKIQVLIYWRHPFFMTPRSIAQLRPEKTRPNLFGGD